MIVKKKLFPSILPDNEEKYFSHFLGFIESIDELSFVEIVYSSSAISFRISTSSPKYLMPLFKEILSFHNTLGLRLDLSKSIKSSGTINFQINLK